mmetsp:Transcript_25691/g.64167  ORF Transcript_25691/g.64167 Transcript_25691/m.64167 type:complete len:213 (+) Transcript_25691:254-892(+)
MRTSSRGRPPRCGCPASWPRSLPRITPQSPPVRSMLHWRSKVPEEARSLERPIQSQVWMPSTPDRCPRQTSAPPNPNPTSPRSLPLPPIKLHPWQIDHDRPTTRRRSTTIETNPRAPSPSTWAAARLIPATRRSRSSLRTCRPSRPADSRTAGPGRAGPARCRRFLRGRFRPTWAAGRRFREIFLGRAGRFRRRVPEGFRCPPGSRRGLILR